MSGSLSEDFIQDAALNPDFSEEQLVALCRNDDERKAILAKRRELQAFYNELDRLAYCGSLDELKAYIEKGSNVDVNSSLSTRFRTPLTSAIFSFKKGKSNKEFAYAKVDYLISLGADVNKLTRSDIFPLMLAVSIGSLDILNRLLDAGANVNFKHEKSNSTVLQRSLFKGDASIFFRLIEAGADVSYDSFPNNLASMLSRNSKSPEFVHDLLVTKKRTLRPAEISSLIQHTHDCYLVGVNIIKEMIIKYGEPDEQAALRESLSRVNHYRGIETPTRYILALDSRPGDASALYNK